MRLLYLSPDPGVPILGHKGASVHVRSLASAFDALGHEVAIASPRVEAAENPLPGSIRLAEIPAVLPKKAATGAELMAQMERQAAGVQALARAGGFDAIYERHSYASAAGARCSRELGLPLLLEVNAPLRLEAARFRELRHEREALTAERESFAAAERIFAVSRALADWLEREGVDPGQIEVVPNAFPLRRFPPKHPLDDQSPMVVGFAGGLKLWHGVDVLLDGFDLALAAGARMRLEVAGTGPAEELLRQSRLPSERFRALGHLPHADVLDALERWDVGVAPFAALEGFWFSPLKLFEYMAAGLCCVASAVGDMPALLEEGRAGVLVPPGDPEALATALVELDRDRLRLRALGRRAREAALRGPSWLDNARRVLAALGAREAA